MEQMTRQGHRWAEEWERLVGQIRTIPKFEGFLRPEKAQDILITIHCSPVVYLPISEISCDALVVTTDSDGNPSDILHIPLSDYFDLFDAQRLHERLSRALAGPNFRSRNADRAAELVRYDASISTIESVLAELWTSIVKPVLEGSAFSPSNAADPPRLWWCPMSPLAFLPLHAAGIYTTNEHGTKVSDYVVSSYTPTLAALRKPLRTGDFHGIVGVIQSATLQYARVELEKTEGFSRIKASIATL